MLFLSVSWPLPYKRQSPGPWPLNPGWPCDLLGTERIQLTSEARPEKVRPGSPWMPAPIHMPGKKSYPLRPPGWRGHS